MLPKLFAYLPTLLWGGIEMQKNGLTKFLTGWATAFLGALALILASIPFVVLVWSFLTGMTAVSADWSNSNVWIFAGIKAALVLLSYWLFISLVRFGLKLLRRADAHEYESEYAKLMIAIASADSDEVLRISSSIPSTSGSPSHDRAARQLAESEFLIATESGRIERLERIQTILKSRN